MTVKEYLNQAYLLDQRIHSHTIECEELKAMAESISSPGFEEHFKYRTFFRCFNLGFSVVRMLDDCDIAFDDLFIHIVCGTVQLYRV